MKNITYPAGSAIPSLIEGYKQFKSNYFEKSKFFADLVQHGQSPKVLMIACCDSRVDPAIITQCKPGDLFVVRNVANLVPPFKSDPRYHSTSAALEHGVLKLGVSDIVVCGHSHCSGIGALMETAMETAMETTEKKRPTDFINAWMDIANPVKQRILKQYPQCSLDDQKRHCEKESLLTSLNNLTTFPWIQERVLEKRLFLHGWYFNLSSGVIETLKFKNESKSDDC